MESISCVIQIRGALKRILMREDVGRILALKCVL